MIEYRGYTGVFHYDPQADALVGHVVGIRDTITFEGASVEEVKQEFRTSVDVYLEHCEEIGRDPAKPYSGRFNIRPGPDLHGRIVAAAEAEGVSMNDWIVRCVEREVGETRKALIVAEDGPRTPNGMGKRKGRKSEAPSGRGGG